MAEACSSGSRRRAESLSEVDRVRHADNEPGEQDLPDGGGGLPGSFIKKGHDSALADV
jgi:hypothetical protein